MNLGELYPENFEDYEINFELDRIYKQHVPHTHEKALEEIFLYGISYAVYYALKGTGNNELRLEIEGLKKDYETLRLKYDALNSKFNINQPTVAPEQADTERAKLITQAMGMGGVFQTGYDYEQRS